MLWAMKKELHLRSKEMKDKSLKTLYFGGGTPSILSVQEISDFIENIQQYFSFDEDIEITLEANPDDLTPFFLKSLHQSLFHNPIEVREWQKTW